jgi:hypothetical protein
VLILALGMEFNYVRRTDATQAPIERAAPILTVILLCIAQILGVLGDGQTRGTLRSSRRMASLHRLSGHRAGRRNRPRDNGVAATDQRPKRRIRR